MPKHRLLQIHLSTAIVLVFAAGGLLILNLHRSYVSAPQTGSSLPERWLEGRWGWPVTIRTGEVVIIRESDVIPNLMQNANLTQEEAQQNFDTNPAFLGDREYLSIRWNSPALIWPAYLINIAAALAILTLIAVACEWRIRRREAKYPNRKS